MTHTHTKRTTIVRIHPVGRIWYPSLTSEVSSRFVDKVLLVPVEPVMGSESRRHGPKKSISDVGWTINKGKRDRVVIVFLTIFTSFGHHSLVSETPISYPVKLFLDCRWLKNDIWSIKSTREGKLKRRVDSLYILVKVKFLLRNSPSLHWTNSNAPVTNYLD